jgi:hypothetical protein
VEFASPEDDLLLNRLRGQCSSRQRPDGEQNEEGGGRQVLDKVQDEIMQS